MKRVTFFSSLILSAVLTACGGGGGTADTAAGGSTGGSTGGTTAPVASSHNLRLVSMNIATTDTLATTAPTQKLGALLLNKVNQFLNRSSSVVMGTAYADSCGPLCQPAYPPANMPAQQEITSRLGSLGALGSLSPVFATTDGATPACDFTNVGVKVNSIWLLDKSNKNALVSLDVPASVDASCNLTYKTGDYVVIGSTGVVAALTEDVISDMSDMIPSGDAAQNPSANAVYLSKSTGVIRELAINASNGTVVRTDLTTASQPIYTADGTHLSGYATYDGTYLVGAAKNFNGLLVYKKGDSTVKPIRSTDVTVSVGMPYSVALTDSGEFISAFNSQISKIDPATGTVSASSLNSQDVAGYVRNFYGRYGTMIAGGNCDYWDYGNSKLVSLYARDGSSFTVDLPYPGDAIPVTTNLLSNMNYSRIAGQYMYCVSGTKSVFVRSDLSSGKTVTVNLDTLGYIPTDYKVYSDKAYATVTNTTDSSVQYIEIDLATGLAKYLGTITSGDREVVDLVQSSNS